MEEILQSILDGSYVPIPVRRKEILKPDGGVWKLGIPTVVDYVIQQAIAQKLHNIWESLFSGISYDYRTKWNEYSARDCAARPLKLSIHSGGIEHACRRR